MAALQLSSDPSEKSDIRRRCGLVMNLADRIKRSEVWNKDELNELFPSVPQTQSNTRIHTSSSHQEISIVDDLSQDLQTKLKPFAETSTSSSHRQPDAVSTSKVTPPISFPHVHRLAEPVSTRIRSKREDITFLKASLFNGFKFPPWNGNPSPTEFQLEPGVASFVDTRDLNLSSYQQQFFEEWARPDRALPPPSHRQNIPRGPVMEPLESLDFVQDAATDCSVVASLCTAAARAERGHDQVGQEISRSVHLINRYRCFQV